MKKTELLALLPRLFPSSAWPRPFHLLEAVQLVRGGATTKAAAAATHSRRGDVERVLAASNPLRVVLGGVRVTPDLRKKASQILGQMLLGRCAELAFEDIYKTEMHTTELELRDLREDRSDTDYRLYNGQGRPIYRINIKFHGSRFRRAAEMVNLAAEDCFALATYKISSALQKHNEDKLPYFFAIVGVSNLSGETVGAKLSAEHLELVAMLHGSKAGGKRLIEDRIVDVLVQDKDPVFVETFEQISKADWYVLSAKRANRLLYEKLFERVYALRVRSFAQKFRGAEVDMHFSLKEDLTPLRVYLSTLRESGSQMITTLLERGEY